MPPPSLSRSDLQKDRFRAALLGLAIGDALAFPYLGMAPGQLARIPHLVDDYAVRGRQFPRGQFAAETQMALALVEVLADGNGTFDGSAFALKLAQLWTRRVNPVLRPEPLCTESVDRIVRGLPWYAAGAELEREGLGAIVRTVGVGLLHHDRPEHAVRDAERQAIVTHKNLASRMGAVAFATTLALNLGDTWYGPDQLARNLATRLAALDTALAHAYGQAVRLADMAPAVAYRIIDQLDSRGRGGARASEYGPRAITTFARGVYAFQRARDDFGRCMELALTSGGPPSTVAAIAGALYGARRGMATIPARLRRHVLDADRIVALGERLYAARTVAHAPVGVAAPLSRR